jgi:heme/copper-type cytochrome/quinol oxidase subunit 1
MLWLGYAGMPRRIQDYPWGYASWHSLATFGHTIVLFGIFSFILTIILAIYLKRATVSRNKGLPFIALRVLFLVLDKYNVNNIKKYNKLKFNNKRQINYYLYR